MAQSAPFSPTSTHLRLRLRRTPISKLPANFRPSFFSTPSLSQPKINLITFISSHLHNRPKTASMSSETKHLRSAMSVDPNLKVFDSEEDLSDSLAKYTADLSKKFCIERGGFTVVLSGGSLVKSLRKLGEAPYVDSVDWGKWHVFWVDERVVPKDHADSNYKLAFDGFLSKVQIPTDHIHAINDSLSAASAAADDYEARLKHLTNKGVVLLSPTTGFPKFDLLLLGMGPDGHIASLFPGHHLLGENERWVASINDSPKPPPNRITLTFPVINSSAHAVLVATGAGKADVVHQVFVGKHSSASLPVEMVKLDDGELAWFVDKAAASKL